ncbi:unnamed protein product [Adineta steineri]|uniref:Carbonic anhydrase n=1 Tax=Adineta steineri TaxID=433720 RepID=A0A815MUG2_9BILA|nr:unnamed protein product [Adineta steineri]CAF3891538.1 unnamed protein product [Adineta steineri]
MSKFIFIIILCLPIFVNSNGHWSYKNKNEWQQNSHYCGGNLQSPIDLWFNRSRHDQRLSPLHLVEKPSHNEIIIQNNGHSVQLNLKDRYILKKIAPLSEDYNVEQAHFHWGHSYDNRTGSEHFLDGQSYPLEMHMVTYSSLFANIGEAASNTRALAVVGILFELSDEPNQFLQPIIDALKDIPYQNGQSTIKNFNLLSLFDEKRMHRYYRYDGSLTTPACFESVIWNVLQEPLPISYDQLRAFQSLYDEHRQPLINTYRKIQPMGTRKLFRSFHAHHIHDNELKARISTTENHAQRTFINMKIILVLATFSMMKF